MALAPELFRVGITPYYASLMDRARADCPVRMQVIPLGKEERVARGEYVDPLGEDGCRRRRRSCTAIPIACCLLALDRCAVYCRHCNRRRLVGQDDGVIAMRGSRRRSTTCGARRRSATC